MEKKENFVQKKLIKQAELAHAHGLRHPGLSGTICEDLLLKTLRTLLPQFNFDRGIIKFGDVNKIGNDLKKGNLSTQFDIIVYKNKPLYREADSVIVHSDNVLAVIEVKKWITLKMFSDLKESINKIKKNYKNKTGRELKFILVAFRCHDRGKGIEWWKEHVKILPTKYSVCFSGNFSHKNGVNLYPHEEKWWKNFDQYSYAGQHNCLINYIRSLLQL